MMNEKTQVEYLETGRVIRRALHQIPEESFSLHKTQQYIVSYLEKLGYQAEKIENTGVLLFIEGKENNTLGIRVDMDALCITEKNTVDYISQHPGMMHACGHDGHMTMNLLLAKYLKEMKEKPKRNVLLIFQPGEEGPGGAKPIVDSGILKKYEVKSIIGYHLFPFIEEGIISSKPGAMMAKNSEFYFTIYGKSGHGAEPHKGIDAILGAVTLIKEFQDIISRNLDPQESAVLSVGEIQGGIRVNVIADEVKIGGTLRSFSEKTHEFLQNRMIEIAQGVELCTGCQIEKRFDDMYPPVINDQKLYEVLRGIVKESEFKEFKKVMLSEDFSYYQKQIPGIFIGLGTGNEKKGFMNNLHSSTFNFDEEVLLKGIEVSLGFINYDGKY